jgi:hypothetical protein
LVVGAAVELPPGLLAPSVSGGEEIFLKDMKNFHKAPAIIGRCLRHMVIESMNYNIYY